MYVRVHVCAQCCVLLPCSLPITQDTLTRDFKYNFMLSDMQVRVQVIGGGLGWGAKPFRGKHKVTIVL